MRDFLDNQYYVYDTVYFVIKRNRKTYNYKLTSNSLYRFLFVCKFSFLLFTLNQLPRSNDVKKEQKEKLKICQLLCALRQQ
jgi:hypothetical protein